MKLRSRLERLERLAGAHGLLVADLPVEEMSDWQLDAIIRRGAEEAGLTISDPPTDEELEAIIALDG